MTAEHISLHEFTDNVTELQKFKSTKALAEQAIKQQIIPPVVEWGPTHLRNQEDLPTPTIPMDHHTFED